MNQGDNHRLDRIEEKIDKMTEAVIALARAEEKIVSLDETTRMILSKMVDQDKRLRLLESSQLDTDSTIKTIKAVTFTAVSALITSVVGAIIWLLTGAK